jgi:hypothetical protein
MTNDELRALLADKSEDWRAGFFKAVNLSNDMKAAFLKGMIGERVVVEEVVVTGDVKIGAKL